MFCVYNFSVVYLFISSISAIKAFEQSIINFGLSGRSDKLINLYYKSYSIKSSFCDNSLITSNVTYYVGSSINYFKTILKDLKSNNLS